MQVHPLEVPLLLLAQSLEDEVLGGGLVPLFLELICQQAADQGPRGEARLFGCRIVEGQDRPLVVRVDLEVLQVGLGQQIAERLTDLLLHGLDVLFGGADREQLGLAALAEIWVIEKCLLDGRIGEAALGKLFT